MDAWLQCRLQRGCQIRQLEIGMPYVDEDTYYGQFEVEFKNYWTNGSYYCILAGLGREPKRTLPLLDHCSDRHAKAEQLFSMIRNRAAEAKRKTPTNYELLYRLHRREQVPPQ
jgi:tryptophan 6-halogenase